MRRTLIGKQRVGRAQRKIQKRTVVLQTQPLGSHHLGGMSCPRFGKSAFRAFRRKSYRNLFSEGNGQIIKQELKNEYHWQDLTHFEGNANAFRLLTHQFQGRRPGGFALTYSTLASIIKYPYSSIQSTKKENRDFSPPRNKTSCVSPVIWDYCRTATAANDTIATR